MQYNFTIFLWEIIQVHMKIRPWKCDICGKGLTEKSKLKMHIQVVHLGKKNFR